MAGKRTQKKKFKKAIKKAGHSVKKTKSAMRSTFFGKKAPGKNWL